MVCGSARLGAALRRFLGRAGLGGRVGLGALVVPRVAADDDLRRQDDDGLRPVVGGGPQRHLQAVPVGDGRDDEQPELGVLAHVRQVEVRGRGEELVGAGVAVRRHAESPVLDFQGVVPVGEGLAAHGDAGVRWGEGGGVLQKLGEKPNEVASGIALQSHVGHGQQPDALVVLDLAGGGPCGVLERDGVGRAGVAGGGAAGEEHQVFGVAPQLRAEVVDPEQRFQDVGIGLGVFQGVQ
ncbi:hypothetical protein NORO109296_26745 [Nocardiopsis rhodophaea]